MAFNLFLVAAGFLLVGLGVFHSLLGERFIVRRLLRRENLPKLFGDDSFTKLTIRYAWHLLTLFVVAVAMLLFVLASSPLDETSRTLAQVIALLLLASTVWAIAATHGRHLSWVVLLVASWSTWMGAR